MKTLNTIKDLTIKAGELLEEPLNPIFIYDHTKSIKSVCAELSNELKALGTSQALELSVNISRHNEPVYYYDLLDDINGVVQLLDDWGIEI